MKLLRYCPVFFVFLMFFNCSVPEENTGFESFFSVVLLLKESDMDIKAKGRVYKRLKQLTGITTPEAKRGLIGLFRDSDRFDRFVDSVDSCIDEL